MGIQGVDLVMRVALSLTVFSILMVPSAMAGAPTIAKVQSASGEAGSVRVFRGGISEAVSTGDELQLGDRVVTRPGGAIELQFDNCTATLDQPDTLVITEDVCGVVEARFSQPQLPGGAQVPLQEGAAGGAAGGTAGGAATGGGIGTGAAVGIGVGVVAVGVGVGVGVSGGDDDDPPASP